MKILEITPPLDSTITFYDADQNIVGTLDLKGMTFTGDADKAAQVFFKNVLELYANELTRAKQKLKEHGL